MCVIVDVNIAHRVFLDIRDVDYSLVRMALQQNRIKVIYGGKLTLEYAKNNALFARIMELDRAGRAVNVDEDIYERSLRTLERQGACVSNDPHIIALAKASGARVLCTNDEALIRDFKNVQLLQPKGKVYKNSNHRSLLRDSCSI